MSILWRSWLTFSSIIIFVLMFFAVVAVLQHNAVLAGLIKQRLTVVSQSTASAFRPIVNLGLPVSMLRNARAILQRQQQQNPSVSSLQVINPSGIVVHSTEDRHAARVSRDILRVQSLNGSKNWGLETEDEILGGFNIANASGTVVGAVVVAYPKLEFNIASLPSQ